MFRLKHFCTSLNYASCGRRLTSYVLSPLAVSRNGSRRVTHTAFPLSVIGSPNVDRPFLWPIRFTSSNPSPEKDFEKHEFQAETKQLLDIVARSLYSDKEVFIRELISNANDALEKFRYLQTTSDKITARELNVKIITNKQERTLTILDNGIGMNKHELISNLGTIARSGSKVFLEELQKKGFSNDATKVIGQFGVGFYSVFMVADKVEVITRSCEENSKTYKWTSDGLGSYQIESLYDNDFLCGMKIVIYLKPDCREFADDQRVEEIIKKYSNFVNSPILLNGVQINQIQPLWVMDPKTVAMEQHQQFYKFISNSADLPRFVLHFRIDVPISLKALLYFPERKLELFELERDKVSNVSIYSNRVLIKTDATSIVPKWLRFMTGVIDSEDIPLNLSRELLQNTALLSKLKTVISTRAIKFLCEKSTKEKTEYNQFYKDFSVFIKEGIVTSSDYVEKEQLGPLLRYESSKTLPGECTTLPEYCDHLQPGQKNIFYVTAPSRILAENSPYLEALKENGVEVLFCYEAFDELVLLHLNSFKNHKLISIETEMRNQTTSTDKPSLNLGSLSEEEANNLISWIKDKFKGKIYSVCFTNKLDKHPCVVTVEEMAAARHFIRTQSSNLKDEMKMSLLQPRLELNARHPIIKKLSYLLLTNPQLAELITEQLFSNAMVIAGLTSDARSVLKNMNKLLELALEKH